MLPSMILKTQFLLFHENFWGSILLLFDSCHGIAKKHVHKYIRCLVSITMKVRIFQDSFFSIFLLDWTYTLVSKIKRIFLSVDYFRSAGKWFEILLHDFAYKNDAFSSKNLNKSSIGWRKIDREIKSFLISLVSRKIVAEISI